MFSVKSPALVIWKVTATNEDTGEIVFEDEGPNLVVDTGREELIKLLFGLTASAPMIAAGVGASSTAAARTDTALTHELIQDISRKPLLNTSGSVLSPSDIESVDFTPSGSSVTYYRRLIARATWPAPGGNDGNPHREFGVFNTLTLPGTPTGTSGVMFNHFVASADIPKDASTTIAAQITVYF